MVSWCSYRSLDGPCRLRGAQVGPGRRHFKYCGSLIVVSLAVRGALSGSLARPATHIGQLLLLQALRYKRRGLRRSNVQVQD